MFSRELPDQRRRQIQLARLTNHTAERLVRRCISSNPNKRPAMVAIIEQLENMAREQEVNCCQEEDVFKT